MGVHFVDVTVLKEEPSSSVQPLEVLVRDIPADLVAELKDACRQSRPARLMLLADRVAQHSVPTAEAIRSLANGFRYRTLLEILDGANGKS